MTVPLDLDIPTPIGTSRAVLEGGTGPGRLVLGHGAGGGIDAPDLLAARDAAVGLGLQVVRVEQPWRVAGRRVAEAPARLDPAWGAVVAARPRAGGPLLLGGRSAGARVACRTAAQVGAAAVVAIAFPLHPPGRPGRSRLDELAVVPAAGLPLLVVQGERDRFGGPSAFPPEYGVVGVPGDHGLRRDPGAVAAAVRDGVVALLR